MANYNLTTSFDSDLNDNFSNDKNITLNSIDPDIFNNIFNQSVFKLPEVNQFINLQHSYTIMHFNSRTAPVINPHVATRGSLASVSESPSQVDFFHLFDRLTAVLRTAHLYDHVPKPCRDKVSKALSALLTAVCDDPCDAAHWCRLQCFFTFVLFKPTRGGRRINQANYVFERWISAVTTRIEQGSLSVAVRLACSLVGIAENSSETLAKLKAIHPSTPLNRFALKRVSLLPVHDALTIIRGALSLPKLMYFLRTSNSVNAAILCEFEGALRASIPVLKKPSGIAAHDGKRPDGCTLIPWRAGRCLAWDVTVPGTFAERYVQLTSKESGLAATRASDEKIKKYDEALPSMEFLPICIEVLGPMDRNTSKFFNHIWKHISIRSGDSREYFFVMNNISCILQRFLRVCV
ncbi:hypothetical protein HELRODRAFT_172776 [Helobdella robusta]|uniref:Uncharacterized protein n=1 Tax=Helobdella robusta TaxID=6412 RepID=T1F5X6_HELRO|nr:hypothetical protein HELRODRAFT_172776 [Helobdella robusta]ESO04394.1 hypothetical protein HELRODRAFT_172776 [Helobdella robusta]